MENYAMNYEEGKKIYTVADIEALPEGERAELIDGEMFMMASPTMTHQRISMHLSISFADYIRTNCPQFSGMSPGYSSSLTAQADSSTCFFTFGRFSSRMIHDTKAMISIYATAITVRGMRNS